MLFRSIRLLSADQPRGADDVEGIGGMEQIAGRLHPEAVVFKIFLFPAEEQARILHLIRDHIHLMPPRQLPVHHPRIVGDAAFIRIDGADENDFFLFPGTVQGSVPP